MAIFDLQENEIKNGVAFVCKVQENEIKNGVAF